MKYIPFCRVKRYFLIELCTCRNMVIYNRGQIKPQDFVTEASGAVSLKADARKLLFQVLQAKKQEKIVHPFLGEEVEIGLLPYIQAMLLARHLRGDLAEYPPFLMR